MTSSRCLTVLTILLRINWPNLMLEMRDILMMRQSWYVCSLPYAPTDNRWRRVSRNRNAVFSLGESWSWNYFGVCSERSHRQWPKSAEKEPFLPILSLLSFNYSPSCVARSTFAKVIDCIVAVFLKIQTMVTEGNPIYRVTIAVLDIPVSLLPSFYTFTTSILDSTSTRVRCSLWDCGRSDSAPSKGSK